MVLAVDGNVYVWGQNDHGQLGNDSTAESAVPVRVQFPVGITAKAISLGTSSVLAIGSDNNVYVGIELLRRVGQQIEHRLTRPDQGEPAHRP